MVTPDRRSLLPRPLRGLHRAAWWLLAGVAWVACGTLTAPQNWDFDRGPVIPHDTFPADCRLCHEGPGWNTIREDFTYDHEAETGVALRGAHAAAECLRCHNDRGPVAEFAARGCQGCHVDPHRGKLGMTCDACHAESDWLPREVIARHMTTRFPLVGAHAVVACWRCHPGAQVGNFEGLDPTCVACHVPDLQRATSPDHRVQGWTSDCQACHVPLAWSPARFDHPASFPLTLGHAGLDCARCHGTDPTFGGLSPECARCHLDEYQATTDPNHAAAEFPTDCQVCHTTATWLGGRFDHPPSFPLNGGHANRRCSECHEGGRYSGTPSDCVACHLDDYQRTTDPNHVQLGFGTDCQTCHLGTNTWDGAVFDHRFPISGGPHGGLSCTDCHTTPGNSQLFSCIDCHEHSQSRMADEHREVNNYSWNSRACLDCHPNGRER